MVLYNTLFNQDALFKINFPFISVAIGSMTRLSSCITSNSVKICLNKFAKLSFSSCARSHFMLHVSQGNKCDHF